MPVDRLYPVQAVPLIQAWDKLERELIYGRTVGLDVRCEAVILAAGKDGLKRGDTFMGLRILVADIPSPAIAWLAAPVDLGGGSGD